MNASHWSKVYVLYAAGDAVAAAVNLSLRPQEEEHGKTVIREKERFSNELTLVFSRGEIGVLK
jgi:hypothetical protein